jgi:hypothetical protein
MDHYTVIHSLIHSLNLHQQKKLNLKSKKKEKKSSNPI